MALRRPVSGEGGFYIVPGRLDVPNFWARAMIEDQTVTPEIRDAALAAARLTVGRVNEPLGFIGRESESVLIDTLTAEIGDPMFPPKAGLRARSRRGGILVYLLCHAATLREAFAILDRYIPVVRPSFHLRMSEREDRVMLSAETGYPDPTGNLTGWTLGAIIGLLREITGREDLPLEVGLAHASRATAEHWSDVLGVPVRDGQPADQLVFAERHAAYPIPNADHELKHLLTGIAETMRSRAQARDTGIVGQVQVALAHTMRRGQLQLSDVARQMNLSSRSLQRKLDQEATSFQSVLRDHRRALAFEYLATPDFSLAEIASMLGYIDQASFSRGFKAMTRMTPREFRRIHALYLASASRR